MPAAIASRGEPIFRGIPSTRIRPESSGRRPKKGLGDLFAAGPHKAGHAEYLPAAQLEGNPGEARRSGDRLGLEDWLRPILCRSAQTPLEVAPDHHPHDLVLVELADISRTDEPTVPEDADPLGDVENLLHPVRDVEYRRTLRLEGAYYPVERLDFGIGQSGGGLVHDEDRRVLADGLQYLYHLPRRDPEIAYENARVELDIVALAELSRLGFHRSYIEDREEFSRRQVGYEQVFRDAQVGHQRELLEDDADSLGVRLSDAPQIGPAPLYEHFTGIRRVHAAEDLHEGALACAVLADYRPDLASLDRQADIE